MFIDCRFDGEKKFSAFWNGDKEFAAFGEAGGAEGSDEERGRLVCDNKETDSLLLFVIGIELAPVVRGMLPDDPLF